MSVSVCLRVCVCVCVCMCVCLLSAIICWNCTFDLRQFVWRMLPMTVVRRLLCYLQ